MNKKIGSGTFILSSPVKITQFEAVVGQKEHEGPLGSNFLYWSDDEYFGQKSFEKAETYIQKEAMNHVIEKSGFSAKDIEFIFAGDLLNQCAGSNFCVRDIAVQFFGLYGACSTMAEALILGSMVIDGGFADRTLALTSSHFCSAERQFRFPLEYGAQRPPAAQWTVTGAGCALLEKESAGPSVVIEKVTPGAVCDMAITDLANMGAAMAPAAALTLKRYFDDTKTSPSDYDLIVTGDLGKVGADILRELLLTDGIDLGSVYNDCGLMIYDLETQDVHSGGSGCGCSASVLCGYILPEMLKKTYRNVLFVTTGALMSPTSSLQGESIPGIAHLVNLKV
ncbi:MAG: stage V sporulation protein AD [Clostridia bacterium]|nr:stage V sporulation protein AD [Clostridia bacterium]